MRCRNCKYNGFLVDDDGTPYQWCGVVSDNLDPDEERQCRHYAPATHADQIRAMTDEEMAMLLGAPTIVSPPWCDMNYDCPYIDQDPARCDLCALDWLRQEAEH